MKMLEVRIIVGDESTDEQLANLGEELQANLPADTEFYSGLSVHNVTYEVRPIAGGQAV
jgi:hypothetical protein